MQSVRAVIKYYTYAFLREDGTPYYIGKGKCNRAYDKKRSVFSPSKERILFLKKNLTENEAFNHEIYMISIFGRKDNNTGILLNKTDGGDGVSGSIWTQDQRKKASEQRKQRKWWYKGNNVSHSSECPGEGWKRGRPGINVGRKINEETKNKIRLKHLGKKMSKNFSEQQSISRKGCHWWNNGQFEKYHKECPGEGWARGRIKKS